MKPHWAVKDPEPVIKQPMGRLPHVEIGATSSLGN